MHQPDELVFVIDFGAQYNQLIARRVREQHVYCEIVPCTAPADALLARKPKGFILSGGPASVYAPDAPTCDPRILQAGIPVLGICYGMQVGTHLLGGSVKPSAAREFGPATATVTEPGELFSGLPATLPVWMSHGDQVEASTDTFRVLARTGNTAHAAVRHRTLPFFGVQFHPEVHHTPQGSQILGNFLRKVCGCRGTWQMGSYVEETVGEIRSRVGKDRLLCALSGGVDSAVTARLVHEAIGDQLVCVFVDNGVLRQGEAAEVLEAFQGKMGMNVRFVDAGDRFLDRLAGIEDPEDKRKRIGQTFIDVFADEAKKAGPFRFLAQGTLYPDVIESVSAWGGPTAVIKSHHNVGGLPEKLGFELVEPLRFLFKDEVRDIGRRLGLPDRLLKRQPFPGPGLAVRTLGAVNRPDLDILRKADAIVREEVEKLGAQAELWQYFAVLLPIRTVGVMGDGRTYDRVIAIRAVQSLDGMTADWARLPADLLAAMSSRIINEVKGVNRVVYDISSKPPSTIEWE